MIIIAQLKTHRINRLQSLVRISIIYNHFHLTREAFYSVIHRSINPHKPPMPQPQYAAAIHQPTTAAGHVDRHAQAGVSQSKLRRSPISTTASHATPVVADLYAVNISMAAVMTGRVISREVVRKDLSTVLKANREMQQIKVANILGRLFCSRVKKTFKIGFESVREAGHGGLSTRLGIKVAVEEIDRKSVV